MTVIRTNTASVDNDINEKKNRSTPKFEELVYVLIAHGLADGVANKQVSTQLDCNEMKARGVSQMDLLDKINHAEQTPYRNHEVLVKRDVSAWGLLTPWTWTADFWSHDLWHGYHEDSKENMALQQEDAIKRTRSDDQTQMYQGEMGELNKQNELISSSMSTEMETSTQMMKLYFSNNDMQVKVTAKTEGSKYFNN